MNKNIILICLLSTVTFTLKAQIIKPDTTKRHFVNFNFGYDYNLISLNLGYAYYYKILKYS